MARENENESLKQRLSRLEARVAELEHRLKTERTTKKKSAAGQDKIIPPGRAEKGMEWGETIPEKASPGAGIIGENWLNRIGLFLLLLGVAFLFKYSIDQGWLIPPVRSAFGLAIGLALFGIGIQMGNDRSPMKEILLGGGIAAFYITGFATYQLYNFVADPVVWSFMIVVTLLALSLSLQQDQPVLSVIGILGGLGTPFMLYSGSGSLPALIIYASLVLAAGAIIYFQKGWKSLIWSMTAGGILVYLAALFANILDVQTPLLSDRWALQAGVMFGGVVFWMVPVYREIMAKTNPENRKDTRDQYRTREGKPAVEDQNRSNTHVQILSLVIPLFLYLFSLGIWELPDRLWGGIALVCALPVGYSYLPLRVRELPGLASVHAFSGLALLTLALVLLFNGYLLLTVLAFEAVGLRYIAMKSGEYGVSFVSHLLFGFIALWMTGDMLEVGIEGLDSLDIEVLVRLAIILSAGLAVPLWIKKKQVRFVYRIMAHLALLGWFFNTFMIFANGQAVVTASWGIYAIALLVSGFYREKKWLRGAGMATIFLVIGKLFIVDLSQLQAIWRILLFMGFGSLLLVLSYFIQFKWGKPGD